MEGLGKRKLKSMKKKGWRGLIRNSKDNKCYGLFKDINICL